MGETNGMLILFTEAVFQVLHWLSSAFTLWTSLVTMPCRLRQVEIFFSAKKKVIKHIILYDMQLMNFM